MPKTKRCLVTNKKKYKTKEEAIKFAKSIEYKFGRQNPYFCKYCSRFHLTRKVNTSIPQIQLFDILRDSVRQSKATKIERLSSRVCVFSNIIDDKQYIFYYNTRKKEHDKIKIISVKELPKDDQPETLLNDLMSTIC